MKSLLYFTFFLVMITPPLMAHHFKGMPHFSYFDNYPQVPTEEYIGQAGRYEFAFMVYDFQGLTKNDMQMPDDVRVYLIVYDLIANKAYRGPLTLEILDGEESIKRFDFKKAAEESIYQLQQALDKSGDFSLRITIREDGKIITGREEFLLSNQRINWAIWISSIMFVLVVIVAWGSRQARLKQDRKDNILATKNSPAQEASL